MRNGLDLGRIPLAEAKHGTRIAALPKRSERRRRAERPQHREGQEFLLRPCGSRRRVHGDDRVHQAPASLAASPRQNLRKRAAMSAATIV